MANPSKAKGTAAESATVRYLLEHSIPAHRTAQHGAADVGDIHALNGRVVLEVKAHKTHPSPGQLDRWMTEADTEAARVASCDVAALIVKRPGSGKPADWSAHMRVIDLLTLLNADGVPCELEAQHTPITMPLAAYVALLRAWSK